MADSEKERTRHIYKAWLMTMSHPIHRIGHRQKAMIWASADSDKDRTRYIIIMGALSLKSVFCCLDRFHRFSAIFITKAFSYEIGQSSCASGFRILGIIDLWFRFMVLSKV